MDAKNSRIHNVLDGEANGDANGDATIAPTVAAYRRCLDPLSELRRAPPEGLEERIMANLPLETPRRRLWARVLSWWPRNGRWMAPALAGAAAVLVAVGLQSAFLSAPAPLLETGVAAAASPARMETASVQFELYAPAARKVELVGDFTGWKPGRIRLEGPDASGHWTATVTLPRGRHEYFFLLDDVQWRTDPGAVAHRPDGFGRNNALIDL